MLLATVPGCGSRPNKTNSCKVLRDITRMTTINMTWLLWANGRAASLIWPTLRINIKWSDVWSGPLFRFCQLQACKLQWPLSQSVVYFPSHARFPTGTWSRSFAACHWWQSDPEVCYNIGYPPETRTKLFIVQLPNRFEILHRTHQLNCHSLYKISKR